MQQNDQQLYAAFTEQMQQLEQFRMTYKTDHPSCPIDRDDPDVKRLIEAMAFFSARTHHAARRQIDHIYLRTFQQYFPFLLSATPALGMLQANVGEQLSETIELAQGFEFAAAVDADAPAVFKTLTALRILPIWIKSVNMMANNSGFRCTLTLQSQYPRMDTLPTLNLHINQLNDYIASQQYFQAIRSHLQHASVFFDEDPKVDACGEACAFSFGLQSSYAQQEKMHPLVWQRLMLRFPQQNLYVNFNISKTPREWQTVRLCLDFDADWPHSMALTQETFHLFTVPVVNLISEVADPIYCDGTQERFAILHSDIKGAYEMHCVKGVYDVDNGMKALTPKVLSDDTGCYDIELEQRAGQGFAPWLRIDLPEAFEQPRTLVVDAFWHQPWFSEHLWRNPRFTPFRQKTAGMSWQTLFELTPQVATSHSGNMEDYLYLLTIKNKSTLNREDFLLILEIIGCVQDSVFQPLPAQLMDIRLEECSGSSGSSNAALVTHIYHLTFAATAIEHELLLPPFLQSIEAILNHWLPEHPIELRATITG